MTRGSRCGPVGLVLAIVAQQAGAQVAETRELTVRLSIGGIAAHAEVVALHGADLAASASCDEQGRVQLPAVADRLIVSGVTAVPCDVALAPDATELVLPVARLAGQVLIDGEPPHDPVTVGLVSKSDPTAIPRMALKIIPMTRFMMSQTQTDATGRFDFGLVPDSLSCWLALSRDFGAPPPSKSGEAGLRVEHPAVDLVIRAHALPHLAGRVLDAGGQPATMVQVSFELRGKTARSGGGTTSGDDGRFRIAFTDVPWESGEIRFTSPTGRRTLTVGPGAGSLDVGDVQLEGFAALEVDVRDPDGHPLAGAIVSTLDGKVASAPSGPDGHVSFDQHVAADARLQAALLGYEPCELDPSAPPPRVAVLRPVSMLTLDIVLPDGRPAPKLRLNIRAQNGLYTEAGPAALPAQHKLGATQVNGCERPSAGGCIAWAYLPEGHAVISGLAPGASFDVEVADRCYRTVRAAEAISVAQGEHASRRWVLDRAPRDVTVEVRGPDGALVHAGVMAECMDHYGQDAEGRCLIKDVFADELSFRVEVPPASGLGRTPQLSRSVPDDGVIVVQLVPARSIAIEVVDADGSPVAASGYLHFGKTTTDLVATADGRWTLGGFGEGEVRIEAVSGKLVGSLVQDTAVPVARVVVKPRAR